MIFYEKLINLCNKHRISLTYLVKKLGYSTAVGTQWKNGAVPRPESVKKVADFFGVPVEYFNETDESELDERERELLALYRSMNIRYQAELLLKAYAVKAENDLFEENSKK